MKSFTRLLILTLILPLIFSPSCQTSNKVKGGAVGAVIGGVAGGLIAKNKAVGIIAGAAIGGAAGVLIGHYMDKQAEKIQEDLEGAKVERVGEGILVTFDSGLLFDFDSYQLRQETKDNLQNLSQTLEKYEDTDVLVLGHTDSQGDEAYNQTLSENRAGAVTAQLFVLGLEQSRITATGYGETDPLTENETASGRQQNRRVEIAIVANNKLKRHAKKGKIPEA